MKLRISSSSKYFFLLCTPRLYRAKWTTSTLMKDDDSELKLKIPGRQSADIQLRFNIT